VLDGNGCGGVGRTVVGDDDAANGGTRDVAQDEGKGALFIESGDDYVDRRIGGGFRSRDSFSYSRRLRNSYSD
ncbi:MAG: hypothetical protein JSV06_04325, partial [Myxococcales bacterium]